MSIQAYQRASAQAENPRETEYRLFATITSGLIKAKEQGRAHLGSFAEALDKNRRLWTLLANDCASEENALPAPLRAQIISLSMWVSRQTSAAIQDGEDIEPLIEVNRTVMQGLAPQLSAAPSAAAG
jgi:flagellar protein FlaF